MQESNNNTKTSRTPFVIFIAGVIVLIHLAVIFAVKGCNRSDTQENTSKTETPAVTAPATKQTEEPGFWKRLFSGKKEEAENVGQNKMTGIKRYKPPFMK